MSDHATLAPTRATPEKKPSVKKARKATSQPPTLVNEADQFALKAAGILQGLVLSALYDDADRPRLADGIKRLQDADHLLGRLLQPENHEWCPTDPTTGDIKGHLEHISRALEDGFEQLQGGVPGLLTWEYAALSVLAWHALDYSERLRVAYSGLPTTLVDLCALSTQEGAYAGIKRHRDPPQPPLRRVNDEEETAPLAGSVLAPAQEIGPNRFLMQAGWFDAISLRLEHADTILGMLTHIFLGDVVEEPSTVPGLMGAIQHVKWLLGTVHSEMREDTTKLPEDLRWRTFEASELIDALEHLEFEAGFRFKTLTQEFTYSYFCSVQEAVKRARAALETVETTP